MNDSNEQSAEPISNESTTTNGWFATFKNRWKNAAAEKGWTKAIGEGLGESAMLAGFVASPITAAATSGCQARNIEAQAQRAQQQSKQLASRWAAVNANENEFLDKLTADTQTAQRAIAMSNQAMAAAKILFLQNYKNTQKIGMFLITVVFFALLIKWVFFGKNVDPFIPGLVGKTGKKRSTSRRKSKKKWWKF